MRVCSASFLAILSLLSVGYSNPVNLEAPANSIGAADPYGNLRIWREIEEVDFGKDLTLPLRIEFSSANQGDSPYAGRGWWIPLIEAKAFLLRETMMQANLLCGKSLFLRRDKNDFKRFYTLDKEWTGVVSGEDIIISRADGWELRYHRGLVRQLKTDTGRTLTWARNGNLVTEIREEAVSGAPLRLLTTSGGVPNGFEVNGKKHSFDLDKKPRVRNINGQDLISGFDSSLSSWVWPDEKREAYAFEVEEPEMVPNLKLTDRDAVTTTYTWNPKTNAVISDGEWTYDIGEITQTFGLPRIARKNAAGQEEFLRVDNEKGISEEKTLDGGHKITEVFMSTGPLYGKVRKVETIENDVRRLAYQASYDDLGRLIRETNADGFTTAYTFDKDGKFSGRKLLKTGDEEVLKAFQLKEQALMRAIGEATSDGLKQEKVQDLAFFYIAEMRNPEKALALAQQVTDRKILFSIKLLAVNHNDLYTYAAKIAGYKRLVVEFPEEKQHLEWLISSSEEMISAGKSL